MLRGEALSSSRAQPCPDSELNYNHISSYSSQIPRSLPAQHSLQPHNGQRVVPVLWAPALDNKNTSSDAEIASFGSRTIRNCLAGNQAILRSQASFDQRHIHCGASNPPFLGHPTNGFLESRPYDNLCDGYRNATEYLPLRQFAAPQPSMHNLDRSLPLSLPFQNLDSSQKPIDIISDDSDPSYTHMKAPIYYQEDWLSPESTLAGPAGASLNDLAMLQVPNSLPQQNTLESGFSIVGDTVNSQQPIEFSFGQTLQTALVKTEEVRGLGLESNSSSFSQKLKYRNRCGASLSQAIGSQGFQSLEKSTILKEYREDSGECQGMTLVLGPRQKQRTKQNINGKKLTREPRQFSVCPKCKRDKNRCQFPDTPYQPCLKCLYKNPRNREITCSLRESIPNIFLFRLGPPKDYPNHPLNFFKCRESLFDVSVAPASSHLNDRELILTQDLGGSLRIIVTEYKPLAEDKTAYEWTTESGIRKEMRMPLYCIKDISKAHDSMVEYFKRSGQSYIERLPSQTNAIIRNSFLVARNSKNPMVRKALSLYFAARLIEKSWRICGPDTLGQKPIDNISNPWHGTVPIPPIMDQQLDQIVIRGFLAPRGDSLLSTLNEKIYNRGEAKENEFDIFLTIVILLNNCETQLAHGRAFAKRYGFSGRYGPLGKYVDAESQFDAARTILAHFHHICRGTIAFSRGFERGSETGEDKLREKYMTWLKQEIESKESQLKLLRAEQKYESDLYFIHQMFFPNWIADKGHIAELVDETIESCDPEVIEELQPEAMSV